MLTIQKYGGSSLASPERMEAIAKYIYDCRSKGSQLVIVVSAMGNQTDALIQQAHSIHSQPPARELDMLVSVGERISMAMLSIALHKFGVPAISLTGSQSGILTDSHHGDAKILKINPTRIKEQLAQNKVVIVAGFQGVCPIKKEITTLGRGGSDLTAIALSHALQAKDCHIYTDVSGFHHADPRSFQIPHIMKNISWDFCSTAAIHGANVIHARAAILAQKHKIPFSIRSSFDFKQKGTLVSEKYSADNFCLIEQQNLLRVQLNTHQIGDFSCEKNLHPLSLNTKSWNLGPSGKIEAVCNREQLEFWSNHPSFVSSKPHENVLQQYLIYHDRNQTLKTLKNFGLLIHQNTAEFQIS